MLNIGIDAFPWAGVDPGRSGNHWYVFGALGTFRGYQYMCWSIIHLRGVQKAIIQYVLSTRFITTYNKTNPNLKEIISNHWAYLGRSSATRDLSERDFMITYKKPPSLKDMLVKAKLTQPRHKTNKECKRPKSCKYCTKMSQSGKIKNLYNNKTYNTTTKGTCQSNNLVYCIECNWCHIKYVGQTKNRIIDRFQGHLFDIKNNLNTTVARHFGGHNDRTDPNMTIHILEYIRLP